MRAYGYEKIETPIIQPAELFLTKAGDQIITRLFTFERMGRQLALRPEFTALAAHTYITRYPDQPQRIVRWQFGGSIFDEGDGDPQRYSIGAELIGMGGAAAEAEMMALAVKTAAAQGLTDVTLVVGHVELMRLLLERFQLDSRTQRFLLNHLHMLKESGKDTVLEQLDKLLLGSHGFDEGEALAEVGSELSTQQMLDVLLDATQRGVTMGGRTRHDIVRRLLQKRQRASERGQIVAALGFLEQWSAISSSPSEAFDQITALIGSDQSEARYALKHWQAVMDMLSAYGIAADNVQIQPGLARSWDYYTGIVFELWSSGFHFGGGGRYDDLTRLVGGDNSVPAVGFAYYVDQLLLALPDKPRMPQPTLSIVASAASYASAIRWAETLRARGHAVALFDAASQTDNPLIAESNGELRYGDQTFSTYDALANALANTLEITP